MKKEFIVGHSYTITSRTQDKQHFVTVWYEVFFCSKNGVLITYINQLSDYQVLA